MQRIIFILILISVSSQKDSFPCISGSIDDSLLKILQPNFDPDAMFQNSDNNCIDDDKSTSVPNLGTRNDQTLPNQATELPTAVAAAEDSVLPNYDQCGKSASVIKVRIAGGTDAGLGTFPWMALVGFSLMGDRRPGPVQFGCGGTLINSNHILTAAHCVAGLPTGYSPVLVRLGEYNQSSPIDCVGKVCAPPPQDVPIAEVIPHEEYDRTQRKENDIALIRLERKVELGQFVSPICLPHVKAKQTLDGHVLTVAGWGRTTGDNPDNSPTLQMVTVPFQPKQKCSQYYGTYLERGVDVGRFCAGGESGKDSCKGDSGGPLMMDLKVRTSTPPPRVFQVGVVSLGPKGCEKSLFPGLYTNVSHYMGWILQHLK